MRHCPGLAHSQLRLNEAEKALQDVHCQRESSLPFSGFIDLHKDHSDVHDKHSDNTCTDQSKADEMIVKMSKCSQLDVRAAIQVVEGDNAKRNDLNLVIEHLGATIQ